MARPRHLSEAAIRAQARREREDGAPRLKSEVPHVTSLHLEIEERHGTVPIAGAHIRRIVVDHAPALFVLPCGERSCQDGGHDLTRPIMAALRSKTATITGDDDCSGYLPNGERCGTTVHYVMVAGYEPDAG